MKVIKNQDGNWGWGPTRKKINPVYKESLIKHLNNLDPLFIKAKEKCEFEFILTLFRTRGVEDPGWDSYENTREVFRCISKLKNKVSDFDRIRHIYLWLYGHIIEASEPYEILANLINVISARRYSIENFPDNVRGKYKYPQSPLQKIDRLITMATPVNVSQFVIPLRDLIDRELRNAIFHSDYALYEGEVRIKKPIKSYSSIEINAIINKALAYHEAFEFIYLTHLNSYQEPKIIPVHPEFSRDPNEKAITIIRNGYGLVGLKDNWTKNEIQSGHIPFMIGKLHRYEWKLLEKNPFLTLLPKDKIVRINKLLDMLPKLVRKHIVKRMRSMY